ncbi:MurR/RpiR family transcriptional regulator [Roseovarius sp. C7]|uniref:MurR/RpiR family transcriptional regulator n=1 Tax=Roseovarius sp. C7 TaxID=3398643 RepID=UPI0039F6BA69
MPRKLARAARYVIDRPDHVALGSMRAVAQACGVAPTTMQRLAHEMGYESYDKFREVFQRGLVGQNFGAKVDALQDNFSDLSQGELAQAHLDAVRSNLEQLQNSLNGQGVEDFARSLHGSRQCHIIAGGTLSWIAGFMEVTGNMALSNLVTPSGPAVDSVERIANIGPEDMLLVVTVSPYAKQTIAALEYASDRGAKIYAITDRPSSPVVPFCRHVFLAPTTGPHYYPSMAGVVSLVELLLATAAAAGNAASRERLRTIENIRSANHLYLD